MPARENFNDFFENELQSLLNPLELKRKKLMQFAIIGFVLLGLAIILFLAASSGQSEAAALVAFLILIPAIILLIIYYNKKKHYTAEFKETIISEIICFINPSFRYNPSASVSRGDYDNSGLFLQKPDSYNGDDYTEGTHGKTFFCFSELHTEYKVSSGKQTSWVTIFKGLFFIGDFNKNFSGRTYVWSEENPQLNFFNKLFSSFANNLEKVQLESPEFERSFVVYSNDQVEARYILTPSFMERLIKLEGLMGTGISFSFVNTNIYVAVPVRRSLFEPSIFSRNDYKSLEDYYNTVHIVLDIIDELNLNLRIWTKE